jgi:mono/diheme cytochrome c family protein
MNSSVWALVAYVRSLGDATTRQGAVVVPTLIGEQLAMVEPHGDAVHQGATVYFAEGCAACHGPIGNAPGRLYLQGGREAAQAVRQGRLGMPKFNVNQISDTQLTNQPISTRFQAVGVKVHLRKATAHLASSSVNGGTVSSA